MLGKGIRGEQKGKKVEEAIFCLGCLSLKAWMRMLYGGATVSMSTMQGALVLAAAALTHKGRGMKTTAESAREVILSRRKLWRVSHRQVELAFDAVAFVFQGKETERTIDDLALLNTIDY